MNKRGELMLPDHTEEQRDTLRKLADSIAKAALTNQELLTGPRLNHLYKAMRFITADLYYLTGVRETRDELKELREVIVNMSEEGAFSPEQVQAAQNFINVL